MPIACNDQQRLAELLGEEGYVGPAQKTLSFPAEKYSLRWFHKVPKPPEELLEIAEEQWMQRSDIFHDVQGDGSQRDGFWIKWTVSKNAFARAFGKTLEAARMACAIKALERLREERAENVTKKKA